MYPPGGPRQPEVDLDQLMANLRASLGRMAARLGGGGVGAVVLLVIGLIAVIWVATGFYRLGPGEHAAQRRFGAICGTKLGPCIEATGLVEQPGLHWWWPGPVGKKDVLRVTETRRMELGFRSGASQGVSDVPIPGEALMISGDLNIVDVHMVVQYNIKDLKHFLFKVNDPGDDTRDISPGRPDGRTLKDAAEAALRLVVGQRTIEDVLTEQRTAVEGATKERLQGILDRYDSGINILSVQLLKTQAPDEVFDSFEDVLRARQEKETRINEALAYENSILPRAQGDAERIKREAEAFALARVARARGESGRFISVLEEFRAHAVQLRNVLQDSNNADGDGNSTTGIGLADVSIVPSKQADGEGSNILVKSITIGGAGLGNEASCMFTSRDAAAARPTASMCSFSINVAARTGELVTGDRFAVDYLGNEDLVVPLLVGSGPFEIRLTNRVLDTDNADGDNDPITGITASDIKIVAGPDGGAVPGFDIAVIGFDPQSNVVTFGVQRREVLKAGDLFTVQYLNRENLSVPATSEVTQQRLYLEAIEAILPNINKIIVSPGAESVLILGGREGLTPIPLGPNPAPQR